MIGIGADGTGKKRSTRNANKKIKSKTRKSSEETPEQ